MATANQASDYVEPGAYRLYYLDGSKRIVSAEWFSADSDDEAIAHVANKVECPPCELWARDRLIGRFPLD